MKGAQPPSTIRLVAIGYIFPGGTDTTYFPGKLIGNVFTTGVFVNGVEQFIPAVTPGGIIEIGLPLSDISTVAEALNSVIPDAVVSDETYVIGEASEGDPFPGDWSEYELLD